MILLSIGSLGLGLIAWFLPLLQIVRLRNKNTANWRIFSLLSFSACSLSLVLQFFYTSYLVNIEDWSALMDTSDTLAKVALILVFVTITLNALSYLTSKKYNRTQNSLN